MHREARTRLRLENSYRHVLLLSGSEFVLAPQEDSLKIYQISCLPNHLRIGVRTCKMQGIMVQVHRVLFI